MNTIAHMTLDELKQLIADMLYEHDLASLEAFDDEPDDRSQEEVLASIDRNRWTPPPGSPTPAQMIREGRDSQ